MKGPAANRVRLWDLPVRIVHWSFAGLIPALWWTAENDEMAWHMRLGTVLLGLLVFRILWGFAGSSTARFANFVRSPGAVFRYLASLFGKGPHALSIGHNAAGGWSVVALLGLMSLQVSLGLVAGDPDYGSAGPLNHLVGFEFAYDATEWHTELVFNLILVFVGLHLVAIAFYRIVRRDNIIAPMVTGSRPVPQGFTGMTPAPAWRILACALAALVLVAWIWLGA
ncbi:cytochrome b/b6 domain-containing protein [Novosphingobium aureum]|uniref:cytochrome b/b6 domain-containing protein n=1 Tax=Novosphingobium aureum TaxID=2792964 RepID=UPI002B4716E4|nr:cytochrome b/b6 domain-containing protein [Novosphingobium aureum]